MLLRKRSPHLDFMTGARFNGPLDLRAPEDQFTSNDQVRARYRLPVQSRGLEESIMTLLQSWQEGDRPRAAEAADEMERQTRAHFQTQGVPVFAHPILPPQFVRGVRELIGDLPKGDQAAAIGDLVNHFRQDLQPGIAQELELHSPAPRQQQDAAVVARELKPALFSMMEPSHASSGDQRQAVAARQASPVDSYRPAIDRNDGAPMQAQLLSSVDAGPGMIWGGCTPPNRPNDSAADRRKQAADEERRQQAADNASHLADYNDGRVAETVDMAIASSIWFERRLGHGGGQECGAKGDTSGRDTAGSICST
jgi:hypothetical protein